ncbi:hypothetical protein Tco_0337386 [Tanacetum coccineum]
MSQNTMGGNDAKAGSSRSKRSRQFETVEEVLLPQVHHDFLLWEGFNNEAKSRIDDMLRIKLCEAESNEEIFTYVAWIRAFNIKEPIYVELCHELYSTYEFDEVCADDELQSKKIIKFRLGGRAHNFTLLEFARRMGLYHADELEEDDLMCIFKEACVMKRKGAGTQRESQICCGQFIMKIARKARVLTDVVLSSLSAPIYCRYLDTTTLRELIDSKDKLIPEDPQPSVPRVGIPRPPRASMQDLYDM